MRAVHFTLGFLLWGVGASCQAPRELALFEEPGMMPGMMPAMPEPACPGGPKMSPDCAECVSDEECSGPKPACLATRCVECTLDAHCPMDRTCNPAIAACTLRCSLDEDCKDKDAKLCDIKSGWCVACTEDLNCTKPDHPLCEKSSGRCVACVVDGDCAEATPFCGSEHNCVECTTDAQCPEGSECEVERGKCRAPKP